MALTFKFEQTPDRQLGAIQRVIQAIIQSWNAIPMLSGTDIYDVSFAAEETRAIEHKLGRKYRGWMVVRPRATSPLFILTGSGPMMMETLQDASLDDKQITLHSSTACTFDLRVW